MHKEAVIRKRIEESLISAIACFNEFSNMNYEFTLPKIKETDWEKIANKVNIMAFVQGLCIQGNYSNSYAVVTSNLSNEVINNEDLYVLSNDKNYHKLNCKELIDKSVADDKFIKTLYAKQNLKVKKLEYNDNAYYYYPQIANNAKENYSNCYNCIVNISDTYLLDEIINGNVKNSNGDTIYEKEELGSIRKAYFTSIAREKYDLKH